MELYRWVLGDDMNEKKIYCFVNPDTQHPWSITHLEDVVSDYCDFEFSGIDKHITPHSFRRSYATNLYNNGVDVKKIQKLLGHARIEMTLGYI